MEKTMDDYWDDVADEVSSALAITWDECHKIYVLMDAEQLAIMDGYGYDLVDVATLHDPVALLKGCGIAHVGCGLLVRSEQTMMIRTQALRI